MASLVQMLMRKLARLSDLPPLVFRLILAYGFYGPAKMKLSNVQGIIDWFGTLGIPAPALNAYMAIFTECSGVLLLLFGLATRIITLPLMVVMIVAVKTVHWEHGFSCGDNGFEVPFYYFWMLFSLMITGPGRVSVDHFIRRKFLQHEEAR